ncbi:type II toxin-antitoxin system RelE/ParE family toxin [Rubrivivax sp. JA1024]|nr:type II toxin-antitoxin system RelE/ParE family toxin [Rubrivivax sp. JA1024]
MKVRLSGDARNYLLREAKYLAERSPAAATAFLEDIRSARRRLGKYPEIGFKLTPIKGSRRVVVGNYLIDYDSGPDGIEITAIRHGRQSDVSLSLDEDFDYEVDDAPTPTHKS